MNLSSATHFIVSKFSTWWHDREDERLDALMDAYYKDPAIDANNGSSADHRQAVSARHRRGDA